MTYFTETKHAHRTDIEFDSKRFLGDITTALGGATDIDPEYQGGRFNLGELAIYIRAGYGAKARRVTISCGIADRAIHQLAYAQGRVGEFPSISIDTDRPLDAIVKDIRKRLIEAASEPLAQAKALAQKQANTASELKAHADRINSQFPGVVTLPDDNTKREAALYMNGGGCYLSGRLNSDGGIYVDRLGSVPAHKVEALLKLLAE